MYTYIDACIHTFTYTYTHFTFEYAPIYLYTYAHTHTHTHTHRDCKRIEIEINNLNSFPCPSHDMTLVSHTFMRLSDHVTRCHGRRHGANLKSMNDTNFRWALSRRFWRDHTSFAGRTKLSSLSVL